MTTNNMPSYTIEQKAAAFDSLWENCGHAHGTLKDWIDHPVNRAAHEATFLRVPRYSFEVVAEGEIHCFYDVLHHLATRESVAGKINTQIDDVLVKGHLLNLLAVIHRDGGHHTAAVGLEKSVKDAHERWGQLMIAADMTRPASKEELDTVIALDEYSRQHG